MVKFGGHVEAIRDGDLIHSKLYLLPYNEMKSMIHEKTTYRDAVCTSAIPRSDENVLNNNNDANNINVYKKDDEEEEEQFCNLWNQALEEAEADFRKALKDIWQQMFTVVEGYQNHSNDDDDDDDDYDSVMFQAKIRGAHPRNAIQLYVQSVWDQTTAQELLLRMKQVYRSAEINAEGLRKLVKKYDKHKHRPKGTADTDPPPSPLLSVLLLPSLYASNLFTGQKTLEESIGLLRESLLLRQQQLQDQQQLPSSEAEFRPLIKTPSEFLHQESVKARMKEVEWLQSLVESIPKDTLLPHLVAHRGFHHIKDHNDKRPLENSLSAYEMAWTSGLQLCECDVAITKDEQLVLAHDDNFQRLSLHHDSVNAKRKVSELTFRELLSMPLISGIRPPLLVDVLRSASAISDHSKLIIEVKPGNDTAAAALARFLIQHDELRSNVAVIMSFDAATMHKLRRELSIISSSTTTASSSTLSSVTPSHNTNLPKLMLLTVSQPPKIACELQVHWHELHRVDSWLSTNDRNLGNDHPANIANGSTLDGVYLQYEPEMMTPKGAACLRELSQRCLVGVWGYSGTDPDDMETFSWLVQQGQVHFVNTDLPKHFRKEGR